MTKILSLLFIIAMLITGCSKQNDAPVILEAHSTATVKVTTLAGSGAKGWADGTGTAASFNQPVGLAIDGAGNVFVADLGNNLIRKININGVVTTVAGTRKQGADNGNANRATFFEPSGVAIDVAGNIYVADYGNNMIRKITTGGTVSTFAGSGQLGSADGEASDASFYVPTGVAADTLGNVYVADFGNSLIRKINAKGIVTTLAEGTGTSTYFSGPTSVAVGAAGNIYVADFGNNRIESISPFGMVNSIAYVYYPSGIAVAASGYIYVTIPGYNQIWQINQNAALSVFAGSGNQGADNGATAASSFNSPYGIAIDAAGTIYVADSGNNLIRKISINQ